MALLQEQVDTALPLERAFAFIADFSNSSKWDPGTASSEAAGDPTPRVGARYKLGVLMGGRVAPMEYTITDIVPNERVVLAGKGSNVEATDDIRFERTASGTHINYTANIRLRGWLRLATPFAGRAFASIGRNAREGMQKTLDELARQEAERSA